MANQFREDLYRIYRIGTFWNTIGDTAEHFNQFLFAGIGKKTIMSDLREIFPPVRLKFPGNTRKLALFMTDLTALF